MSKLEIDCSMCLHYQETNELSDKLQKLLTGCVGICTGPKHNSLLTELGVCPFFKESDTESFELKEVEPCGGMSNSIANGAQEALWKEKRIQIQHAFVILVDTLKPTLNKISDEEACILLREQFGHQFINSSEIPWSIDIVHPVCIETTLPWRYAILTFTKTHEQFRIHFDIESTNLNIEGATKPLQIDLQIKDDTTEKTFTKICKQTQTAINTILGGNMVFRNWRIVNAFLEMKRVAKPLDPNDRMLMLFDKINKDIQVAQTIGCFTDNANEIIAFVKNLKPWFEMKFETYLADK